MLTSPSLGIRLPESAAETDEYYEQIKGRTLSTLRAACLADRLRGRRSDVRAVGRPS